MHCRDMESQTTTDVATSHPVKCHSPEIHRNSSTVLSSTELQSPTVLIGTADVIGREQANKDVELDQSSSDTHSIDAHELETKADVAKDDDEADGSANSSDIDSNSEQSVMTTAATTVVTQSQSTRNKRKNFNPRCSSGEPLSSNQIDNNDSGKNRDGNGDEVDDDDVDNDNGDDVIETNEQSSTGEDEALANDQKGARNEHDNAIDNDQDANASVSHASSIGLATTNNIDNQRSALTNKTQAMLGAIHRDGSSSNPMLDPSIELLKQQLEHMARANNVIQHLQQQQLQQGGDPQTSNLQFACNAYIAVQELLSAYGLSISPNDIVDPLRNRFMAGEYFV